MAKVVMSLTSPNTQAEAMEETLDALRPIILLVHDVEIHVTILEED